MKGKKVIIVYTEGETDELFFKKLIALFLPQKAASVKVIVKNLKGIGRYEQKAPAKLKYEILPYYPDSSIIVFCTYDLDVFSVPYQQKPPVDWKKVEKGLFNFGANKVYHIKADKMIEDWFLADKEGLCKFLKIKVPRKLSGNNAYQKIKYLFRKGNKLYQKGYNINNFMEFLDVEKIYITFKPQFKALVRELTNN